MIRLFNKISKEIAYLSFLIFVILYSTCNIFFTAKQMNEGYLNNYIYFGINMVHIVLVLFLLFIVFKIIGLNLSRKANFIFLTIFITISLLIGLYWIGTNHPVLLEKDDALNCYNAAYLVSIYGDLNPLRYKTYINVYPHNLTLVNYFMLFTKLFGDGATTYIRVANLIYVLMGYIGLYGITDILYKNEKINSIMICLMFMSMQYVFYAFFIYGNVISYTTGILSIYFFIKYYKENKLTNLIISMLLIVISSAIKNNSLILLIGELIFLFVKIINEKKFKPIIIVIASVFLLHIMTNGVVNYWSEKADTNYDNRLPKICWIAYGLNYEEYHPGRFFDELELYHRDNDFSVEYTTLRAKQYIDRVINRFKEKPSLIPEFYFRKFATSFANPEYETFAQYRDLPQTEFNASVINGSLNNCLNIIWDAASTVVSIGCLLYVFKNKNNISFIELLCGVIVFGGFLFHAIWETKAVYLYQYYLLLLPYAAKGLYNISAKCLRSMDGKVDQASFLTHI